MEKKIQHTFTMDTLLIHYTILLIIHQYELKSYTF
jgi:hypothetical protein